MSRYWRKKSSRFICVLFLSVSLLFFLVGASFAAGTLTDLQNAIKGTPSGGTLMLGDDYAWADSDFAAVSNDGVLVDRAITIDGNGKSVSGGGKTRVLRIEGVKGSDLLTIKNLTVKEGGNSVSGAGIFVSEGNRVRFEKCTVTKNGTKQGTHTKDGGAIFIDSKAVVSFKECVIKDNLGADRAAGVYLKGNGTFEDCTITGNIGSSRGGGVYVDPGYKAPKRGGEWGGNVVMKNCVITGNKGGRGGGVYVNSENDKVNLFENCTIANNDVSENKVGNCGGILFYNAIGRLSGCSVTDNRAKRGGGVIIDVLTDVTIENSKITGNRATEKLGGGLLCHDGSHPEDTMKAVGVVKLSNNTIQGNTSAAGADDVSIHWSKNDDKSKDVSLGPWVPRYDGKIESLGGNTIGTIVNPRNFTRAGSDTVVATRTELPDGHPDKEGSAGEGGGGGGCDAGLGSLALIAAAVVALRRKI